MRPESRRKTLRFVAAALFMLGIFFGTVQAGRADSPSFRIVVDNDGNRWLTGCASADLAQHLIDHAGFQQGAGPVVILCIVDYTLVSKQLN